MKENRKTIGLCAAAFVCALCATAAMPSARTAAAEMSAIPDFYMNGFGWHSRQANLMPPLPGAPGVPGPIGDHPDHPNVANNSGGVPTPRIGDDTSPLLLPWAQEFVRAENEKIFAGAVPFSAAQRCWPPGVPGWLGFTAEPALFLQTPDMVVIVHQRGQTVRRIYLNQKHSDGAERSWMGESVGHYEGDTLVVDTIGLNDKTLMDSFPIPHSDKIHVVERIRIVRGSPDLITDAPRPDDDPYFINPANKVLQIVATIEDPGAFTAPHSVMQLYELADFPMEESICQENNDDRFGQGLAPMPSDPTPDF